MRKPDNERFTAKHVERFKENSKLLCQTVQSVSRQYYLTFYTAQMIFILIKYHISNLSKRIIRN